MRIIWKILNSTAKYAWGDNTIKLIALTKLGVRFNGTPSYIDPTSYFDGVRYDLIEIGDRTIVSRNVTLLVHDYSITRAFNAVGEHKGTARVVQKIEIGNNAFIGANAIILPGTMIGDNVIVGARAVVRGTIPSNTVIAGNPAKILCSIEEYARKWMNKTYEIM